MKMWSFKVCVVVLLVVALAVDAKPRRNNRQRKAGAKKPAAKTVPAPVCDCPKLNEELECLEGQRRDKFLIDNVCKCPHYRCIWIVCPKPKNVQCKECEVKVEVDNCGCKDFECSPKSPDHCERNKVECNECQMIKQEKDKCGCVMDKCVPVPKPPSRCDKCKPCEECVEIEVGPKTCGLKESVCRPKKCKPFVEKKCDKDCEVATYDEDQCGCAWMDCKKKPAPLSLPKCKKCHEPKKFKLDKCGIDVYECIPSECKRPAEGKEACYHKDGNKKDDCGCAVYARKQCQVVPAGKCAKGSAPQNGADMCGCPHQICVPCEQMYPEPKCKECEIPMKKKTEDGMCTEVVCTPDPKCTLCKQLEAAKQDKKCPACQKLTKKEIAVNGETCIVSVCAPNEDDPKCRCSTPKEPKCGKCAVPKEVQDGNECPAKVCVPSTAPECVKPVCPTPAPKVCVDKCMKPKVVVANGCNIDVCQPTTPKECPEQKPKACPACQQVKVEKDECGCPKFSCEAKSCAPLTKNLIKCKDDKMTPTIGEDTCGCKSQTCIDKPLFCEGPNPFKKDFGSLVLRATRGSKMNVLNVFKEGGPGVKTGEVEKYSDMRQNIRDTWSDPAKSHDWENLFKTGMKKVIFALWNWNDKTKAFDPVVKIVFNGENSNINNWFAYERVLQIQAGPNVKALPRDQFNFWSSDGAADIKRHFYVNHKYSGCEADDGMLAIVDQKDVCHAPGQWMNGQGWDVVPRFLYSRNGGNCKWSDLGCATDADTLTISISP